MNDRTYLITSASIISVVVASAALLTREGGRRVVAAEEAHKELGRLTPLQAVVVPFQIHNGSSRPLRIVGATSLCGPNGCIGPNVGVKLPATIPPGGDFLLDALYKAGGPRKFSIEMTVFTDSEQASKIALRVSGEIVDPEGSGGS